MARIYDMARRSRAAADTRTRIIAAAHRLLDRPDGGSLALQEVAAEAGVSRATIYNSVGSRRELLAAVFEDQGRVIRFDRALVAMQLADPAEAIVATVRESCRAWGVIPDAIRRTLALAVIDPEIGALVRQYERYRRGELALLARRARAAGVLSPALSEDDVTATLALLTSFPAFDHLQAHHGPRAAATHLVRLACSALGITPAPE